jgi:hypothetical protein
LGLWIFATKKLADDRLNDGTEVGKTVDLGDISPSPIPWKGLRDAVLAKSVCKILIADGLGVKILIAKELGALSSDLPVLPSPRP